MSLDIVLKDDVSLLERAKVLARALKCPPGVLVFPVWELLKEAAAKDANTIYLWRNHNEGNPGTFFSIIWLCLNFS